MMTSGKGTCYLCQLVIKTVLRPLVRCLRYFEKNHEFQIFDTVVAVLVEKYALDETQNLPLIDFLKFLSNGLSGHKMV